MSNINPHLRKSDSNSAAVEKEPPPVVSHVETETTAAKSETTLQIYCMPAFVFNSAALNTA